jgi:hypothetical protein
MMGISLMTPLQNNPLQDEYTDSFNADTVLVDLFSIRYVRLGHAWQQRGA